MKLSKKVVVFILLHIIITNSFARPVNMYVAFSTGLNMRKTASLKAELVGKIPYGTKLSVDNYVSDTNVVIVEGMRGRWVPVTFQNKKGYVLNCYLITIVPPKKGTATMVDYIKQLTTPFGAQLKTKSGVQDNINENGYEIKKQLYKNGISWHQYYAYEYGANSYFIPSITIQEAFLIIRQIKEFENAFTEKDEFPTASKKFTKKINGNDSAYELKVDAQNLGNKEIWVKSISLGFEEGAYSNCVLQALETGEVCISYSSGV
jgi:Bacterial SH3 domain